MRSPLVALLGIALAVACAPPRASQFVGADGSRDWWSVECRGDERACWGQAKAACRDNFTVHETRTGGAAADHVEWTVHDGAVPNTPSVAGRTLVLSCAAPTLGPTRTAGPECSTSSPRPNHCEDAAGETFTTGRRYLPPPDPAESAPGDGTDVAANAMNELRTIADGLDADVGALDASVAAVDPVVKTASEFPRTFRMKVSRVKALTRGALTAGNVAVPSDVRVEAVDDLKSLLASIKEVADALGAVTASAGVLSDRVSTARANVSLLAGNARAALTGLTQNTRLRDAERKKASSELAEVMALETEALRRLDELRVRLSGLPDQANQALARLRAGVS